MPGNLYQNLLQDPSIQFPDSSDQASRIASLQRLFAQASGRPLGAPTGPLGSAATTPQALSPYGLQGSPFGPVVPRQRRPSVPPDTQPPPVPQMAVTDPGIDQGVSDLTEALSPRKGGTDPAVAEALAKAEAALRRMPGLPDTQADTDGLPTAGPSSTPARRRALSPLEGPDTGADNPNAPADYYAALRGPEGTKGNYDAVNPATGASGPYQFLHSTWQGLMKTNPDLGLTEEGFAHPSEHPEQHEAAIHAYTADSVAALKPVLGRMPTPGELYAAHFLGAGGAKRFLTQLDQPVKDVMPEANFRANPWLYEFANKPGRALLNHFDKWMSG